MASESMGFGRHKRQLLLFLAAILVPAAVLVGLAVRVIRQEAELAKREDGDQRRLALDQVRRELAARLEAIKAQELNRRIRAQSALTVEQTDPAIVFVTSRAGDRLTPPWGSGTARTVATPQFVKHRRDGEAAEFIRKDSAGAASIYREALVTARGLPESCEARLLLGRVLVKARQNDEALRTYRAMLKECGSETDEDGIAYSLYAAERLIEAKLDPEPATEYLVEQVSFTHWRPPLQTYLMRSLLASVNQESAAKALEDLSTQIHDMEQAVALAREFPRVLAGIESVFGTDSVWFAYGDEVWLIAIAPPAPPLKSLVFAVSSSRVAPPGTKLVAGPAQEGAWLGQGFLNLSVEWLQPGRFSSSRRSLPGALYMAGLALIVGMAILGAYLLLRDVNRDVRTAELRSHFVANVSHELKTPLTAIRMFAETLELGRSGDERTRSEYLNTIVNESERLTRLVDNVLEFSKIEQGKKQYQLRPTALAEVVRSAARTMQYPLAQQGFTLNVSIDEKTPALAADADAMEQAILNLLSNAMKYSGDAREIGLKLGQIDGEVAIDVTDHGLGIAPEDQKRIFEKFYRVRSPETEFVAGTGLGLTLVRHIVHAHGGRVEVRSTKGGGSTFSIRIKEGNP